MHRNYHYIIIGTYFYAISVIFKACFCFCCFKCVNVHTRKLHTSQRDICLSDRSSVSNPCTSASMCTSWSLGMGRQGKKETFKSVHIFFFFFLIENLHF